MKIHFLSSMRPAAGLFLAGSLFLTGCEKKSSPGPAATPDAAVEAAESVSPEVVASTYGFAARVSKDAEFMAGAYRLGALWDKLAASRWVETLLQLKLLRESADFQKFLAQWRSDPGAQHVREVLRGLFGEEFVVAGGEGTGKAVSSLIDIIQQVQLAGLNNAGAASGDPGAGPQNQMMTFAGMLIPVVIKVEIPPVYLACRAGAIRETIEKGTGSLISEIESSPQPGISLSTETVDGGYEFKVLNIEGDKLLAEAGDQVRPMLAQIISDPAEAAKVEAALQAKKVRVAWGWVDDYFVVSSGPDLSHLVFAADPSGSVLANPRLASVVSAHAAKQPLTISWVRASLPASVQRPFEISDILEPLGAVVRDMLTEPELERIKAEARAFDDKYAPQQAREFDDHAGISWWEDGLRAEGWGGVRLQNAPAPQKFAALKTPATLVSIAGSGSTTAFQPRQWIEDFAVMAYSWYNDIVKTKLPPESAQQAAVVDALVIPAVKDIWRAMGLLSEALGEESALIVDTAGVLPPLPGLDLPPAFPDKVRFPRMAIVAEVKDRARLSESWSVIQSVIDRLSAMIPPEQLQGIQLKPVTREAGDASVYHFTLPLDTGDFMPHTAVAKDTWLMGTAPSYAQEVAAATLTPGDPALIDVHVNPVAGADLAESWYQAALATPEINSPENAGFNEYKPDVEAILKLVRAFSGIDIRVFAGENGTRNSLVIRWKDL